VVIVSVHSLQFTVFSMNHVEKEALITSFYFLFSLTANREL